jgi:hypothetical protein
MCLTDVEALGASMTTIVVCRSSHHCRPSKAQAIKRARYRREKTVRLLLKKDFE